MGARGCKNYFVRIKFKEIKSGLLMKKIHFMFFRFVK